ncbi:MAG: hypothetical protein ACTHK3_03335 [Solirubrobacterales bacterium]
MEIHPDPDGEGGSAYLSFHLARWKAGQAGLDISREREMLEADPAFRRIYAQTKAEVPQLLVRCLTLGDLVEGQVLALCCETLRYPTNEGGRDLG